MLLCGDWEVVEAETGMVCHEDASLQRRLAHPHLAFGMCSDLAMVEET